jgi:uncharacterized SAM-binding protein YcdF (DUF218 family)
MAGNTGIRQYMEQEIYAEMNNKMHMEEKADSKIGKNKRFLENYTEMIFLEDEPCPADIIFIPGNGYPQMAEHAAKLWRDGYAPYILPSGRFSVLTGHFAGVMAGADRYTKKYVTEWDFLRDVLITNGVCSDAILREDEATFTYQNAIYSRKAADQAKLAVTRAIICCKAQHARRCKMYYQLLFPEAELLVCPSDVGINKENWYLTRKGREEVLGEVERCGKQFYEIMEGKLL